jgi:ABC transport system ATP-binding/permease protein
MALMSLREVSLSFGMQPVLHETTLHLQTGERICLLGRNGAGKTTLLRLLAGDLDADEGIIDRRPGLRVAFLPQEVPGGGEGSVRDCIAKGVTGGGERGERIVDEVLSRLHMDGTADFASLSAGNKRRALLGRALATEPDMLLLDEPTNHLDIAAIDWLERFLARWDGTVLFVTHDRAFLGALATRIVELDRGRIRDYPGSYAKFLARREAELAEEERHDAAFDKKLAEEEVWLRQGIKARRTRNEGRKRALMQMRKSRQARRSRTGKVLMNVQEAERSGKLVVEAEGIGVVYGEHEVLRDVSLLVLRGDKVGVVGPNGCGKTTLLESLLGKRQPDSGTISLGTRIEVAYFDQLREQLHEDESVRFNVAEGSDTVPVGGHPRHVMSYLSDWLFSSERAHTPVRALSGGERNRLLLSRLFLKPSNVLVLDEPTNDLDVETLELLEARLVDYAGTVLVVSHDRAFLDNVVTSTLAYDGDGRFVDYAGGYSDYLVQKAGGELADDAAERVPEADAKAGPKKKPKTPPKKKRSFKQERELEALPATIESLEQEQAALHEKMADPALYTGDTTGNAVAEAKGRLETIEHELEVAYARWQELDELGG